jgi:hypothetical protein
MRVIIDGLNLIDFRRELGVYPRRPNAVAALRKTKNC